MNLHSTLLRTIFLIIAMAYPGISTGFPVGGVLCPKTNPLVDVINFVGKDQREYLDVGGPKLGLSADEMDRIRKTTGRLRCLLPGGATWDTSASLVGKGDEIVTAGHAFFNPDTNKYIDPLSECTFTNFDSPPATSKLAVSRSHEGLLMGHNYPDDNRNDYAFAKLVKPITSAKPFPVDLSDTPIRNNQNTIVVSARQAKMSVVNSRQPIVEPCGMEEQAFYGSSTLYYNDCTIMPGASGGAQLTRSSDGQLVLKGITIQEGFNKNPGEYNKKAGSFGLTLAIGTRILSDLRKFDPSIQLGAGGVDDSHYPVPK